MRAGAWPSTLPDVLAAGDKTRIAAGCYDLLLLLSDAVEPASGLKILDRAARLHPQPTAAYHLRRAGCLARLGDTAGQHREQELAAKLPAATALDHFLIGREQLASGQWAEAITSLEASLRLDPDQTPAHLLLARAYFNVNPKRLHEAENSLSLCIKSHRDIVGLYLMRALVEGAEGNQALAQIDPRHPAEQSALRQAGRPGIPGCRAGLRRRARPSANRRLSLRAAGEPGRHVLAGRQLRQVACRSRGRHPPPAAAVPGPSDPGPAPPAARAA